MIRLDKYLADLSIGTRTEVKRAIRQGKVKVDNQIVKIPETKIDEQNQVVLFDNKLLSYQKFEYYMLNKPAGVISATKDQKEQTVLDLIFNKQRKDLFPVGRLDKDTEGLLLITNDGELAHRLLSPSKHVDKVYYAKIDGRVTEEDKEAFAQGVPIGNNEIAKPAALKILAEGEVSEISLTIQEGKFHQVKRMFESVGKTVIYLKRISMGSLVLDSNLKPGEYRALTEKEIKDLC